MSLTPPQYKQMKQFLVSDNRIKLEKGSSLPQETKDLILKYRVEDKLGSQAIADILEKNHGTKLDQSTVGGVIRQAKKDKVPGVDIPKKELASSVKQKIYSSPEERKIYKTVRQITANDRKINPNIPANAKFKVQVPSGKAGTSTKMVYTTTESAAENAIKKADKLTKTIKLEKKKPFDRAVKDIHKIAMSDPTDINNVRELARLVYGNNSDNALRMIAQDLIRYQEFLLGFREVPGIVSPKGLGLDEILSEFPSQNQWGKFASEELRRSKLNIRDKLLKTKGPKLNTLRNNIVKAINSDLFNLDEVVGIAATFENAPGYTEIGQVIDKKVNARKNTLIDGPFSRLFPRVLDGTASVSEIDNFNEISKNFQKRFNVDTPIIISEPGKKLDASKYIKNFNALSGPAKKNIIDIAKQGVVIKTKGIPLTEDLKPGTPTYNKLMKFCPNNLAPGGMAGTCSIDEAITGMKNELAAVRNGSASLGAQSRTANKIKNLGQSGVRTIVKAGLLTDVGLEAAIGFDRFISEGDSPMQALRKSYLTAPLRFSGLMKSPEEGQRDELIKAALDKDKVEFVLDQQELINDRNEAVANLNRLKEQYDSDIFSESFIKKQQQDVIQKKQADLKDMYRSGELSRAEKFITGFQDPQSLKIKDRSYFDALKQAEEKVAAERGERKFVPFGPIPMARLLKERIGETVTPDRIKKDMQERFGFTEDETTNLIDSLGGFDKFILDVKNEETARLGGAANMAEGGLIGKKSGPPPESGPNSQGLLSLMKRDIKI